MLKYLVCPGYTHSKNDGELHFISGQELIRLYKVNPRECVIRYDTDPPFGFEKNLRILRPSYSGNYDLKLKEK